MRRHSMLACALLLCAIPSFTARGQAASTDSTGFRAGQWGAEFSLSGGSGVASGVGALRFFSDRRALLVDVNGGLSRESGDAPRKRTESTLNVRIGPRWYRPVKGRVLQYVSLGVIASHYRRQYDEYTGAVTPTSQFTTKALGAGAFGEVGGSWMVTPQLSLGASWQGAVQYARNTRHGNTLSSSFVVPTVRSNVWTASVGTLALRAGVFF